MSGVAAHYVGMDDRSTFGESRLNCGRIIWSLWPAGPVLRITFAQYLIAFCSRLEPTMDVISGRLMGPDVPDNRVKFGHPRIKLSRAIPPEAI